jgi:hypothetical protein
MAGQDERTADRSLGRLEDLPMFGQLALHEQGCVSKDYGPSAVQAPAVQRGRFSVADLGTLRLCQSIGGSPELKLSLLGASSRRILSFILQSGRLGGNLGSPDGFRFAPGGALQIRLASRTGP